MRYISLAGTVFVCVIAGVVSVGSVVAGSSWWQSNNGSDVYIHSGKVGIGTSDPSASLEVVGQVRARLYSVGDYEAKETIDGGFCMGNCHALAGSWTDDVEDDGDDPQETEVTPPVEEDNTPTRSGRSPGSVPTPSVLTPNPQPRVDESHNDDQDNEDAPTVIVEGDPDQGWTTVNNGR